MSNLVFVSLISLMSLLVSSCDAFKGWYAKEFRQGDVTSGIVRLSAQHLSMIASEVNEKFKEDHVATQIVAASDPEEVGKGTVTKTIENLDMDYPEAKEVFKDCFGSTATMSGKVRVVKAEQTVYGRLTNNPKNPVVPDPNQVKITIHVQPVDAEVKFADSEDYLRLKKGDISFVVYPRLAQAQAGQLAGLRVVPTSNNRFENIVMKDVNGTLVSTKVTMPFDISDSDFLMQIGVGENGDENKLEGKVTAFGNTRTIPNDGNGLNPNYRREEFLRSYSCKPDLKEVVEYKSVLLEERMGPGLAGLTTLAMSKIASQLSEDHVCGMASVAFLRGTHLSAEDLAEGYSRGTLPAPCKIVFDHYQTEPDCFGSAMEINGEAFVTEAVKEVRGIVYPKIADYNNSVNLYEADLNAGDMTALKRKPEPVWPKYRQPALMEFTADLSNISVKQVCLNKGSVDHEAHCSKQDQSGGPLMFNLFSGKVTAKLRPVLGKNTVAGDEREHMCSVKSVPIADMEFELDSVDASVSKSGNELRALASGTYRAINGKLDDRENELSGEVSIGKVKVPFKTLDKNHLPLNPDYNAKRFEDSFLSCAENRFVVPASDNDCSLVELGL